MNRAYALLDVKSMSEDERVIEGVASTPTPDRMGDVIDPLGAKFKLPMPLLWQHNALEPIGWVEFAKPTKDGIPFKARLAQTDQPGALKDRLDEAWQSIKLKLVRAVSIGFSALKYSLLKEGGVEYTEWEWLELSAVTIPANAEATIQTIKSIDRELLGAPANEKPSKVAPPGASGSTTHEAPKEGKTMKTIAEQIASFEATRVAKSARMNDLMNTAAEAGATLDAEQSEEYDGLEAEVKSIDQHLVRLRALETSNVAKAVAVNGGTAGEGAASRASVIVVKGADLPKGTAFTRYAIALARSKGNLMQAAEIAKTWADSTPQVETVLKAAVTAGTTTDPTWAKPLVEYQNMASEFAELLRPATIIGRIQGLRRVPFNIKIPRQTGGSSVGWVGQGAPKPVSALSFDQIKLDMAKAAGIVVMSDELVRASNPSAEAIVRQDLIDQTAQFLDVQFVDPAVAAVDGVSPASITNGVTPVVASGTDADAVRHDVKALLAKFVAANLSLAGAVWIMSETQALGMALMVNALGQPEFPGLQINGSSGGTFFGLPVILSEGVPANAGTTNNGNTTGDGARLIIAKASEILLADDGETVIDASAEASLQMDSAPTNPPTATTVFVSLWQMNLLALRAERFINWAKRRPGAVQYIDQAKYSA